MRLHQDVSTAANAPRDTAGRERNADATRTDLLRAAMQRFTVFGFERTTVREIASDAGANVSLINRYFGSKDGLLAAVLSETAHAFDDRPSDGITQPETVIGKLIDGLHPDAWPEFGHENPLLLLLTRDTGGDTATADLRRRTLDNVVERFAADIANRDIEPVEARLRGALLFALMAGVASLHSALPVSVFGDTDSPLLREVLTEAAEAITGPA